MRPIQAPQAAASLEVLNIWSPVILMNICFAEWVGGRGTAKLHWHKGTHRVYRAFFIALLWTLLLFLSPRHPNNHGQKTLKT